MVYEEQTHVAAPAERLFGLLIEPRSWVQWWTEVRFARSADFKPLREGSQFEATLEFGRFKVTIKPRVVLCADAKALAWSTLWIGTPLRQEYYLQSAPDGCRVRARSQFSGPLSHPLKWLRLDRVWVAMIERQLRALRLTAERM
jgi:hypothetical protein